MSRTLSEQKVLKQLKIEDFRHLSKDTVMRFASSIQKMDPEVAKKALEQFPNFAAAVKDGIAEYKEFAENIIKSGDKDHDKLIEMIDAENQQLIKMLDEEELTLDEKFKIMDRLDKLQDKVAKENKDMRMYRLKVASGVLAAIVVSVLSLANVLGGNSELAKTDSDDDLADSNDDIG